jgi:hypothetical protein
MPATLFTRLVDAAIERFHDAVDRLVLLHAVKTIDGKGPTVNQRRRF